MIGARCPQCHVPLPPLKDDHGWDCIDCPKCSEWFDTDKYQKAGGRLL